MSIFLTPLAQWYTPCRAHSIHTNYVLRRIRQKIHHSRCHVYVVLDFLPAMSEQPKSTAPTQEHPYPQPTLVPFPPQAYNGGPYPPPGPPGAYMPPFFAYPPPPDGSHPEGTPNGGVPPHFMIGLPPGVPGVLYAYPPPQTQRRCYVFVRNLCITAEFSRRVWRSASKSGPFCTLAT